MTLQITHTALGKLEESQAWSTSGIQSLYGFGAEEIYGPQGKLNWLWPLRWQDPEQMRSDLCQNMGGGVPIEVIDALVEICVEEQSEM